MPGYMGGLNMFLLQIQGQIFDTIQDAATAEELANHYRTCGYTAESYPAPQGNDWHRLKPAEQAEVFRRLATGESVYIHETGRDLFRLHLESGRTVEGCYSRAGRRFIFLGIEEAGR